MATTLMWSLLFVTIVISNVTGVAVGEDLLSPKAYARMYWEKHVTLGLPIIDRLMERASPLSSAQVAEFEKIVDDPIALSQRLPEFCAQANLMCYLNEPDYKRINPILQANRFNYHVWRKSSGEKDQWGPVPPALFFRESMLKPGTLITMPDFTDKYPTRSFLPRSLVSKIPFSSQKLSEIKNIFHAGDYLNSMFTGALDICELEGIHCVTSIEDMVDFATSVLGKNVVARGMDNTAGSSSKVLLGNIKAINGGKLTNLVTCHQKFYPYMLYYCHSVTSTRVYEVDILDPKTKFKINHGVAICHEDTSSWNHNHPAFMALGTSPGKTEICHFSVINDFAWVNAD